MLNVLLISAAIVFVIVLGAFLFPFLRSVMRFMPAVALVSTSARRGFYDHGYLRSP